MKDLFGGSDERLRADWRAMQDSRARAFRHGRQLWLTEKTLTGL